MTQEFLTVIQINPLSQSFDFYSMTGKNKATITLESKPFKTRLFDEEFFEVFSKTIAKYAERYPSAQAAQVTLVLPDKAIAQDTFNMPTMKKGAMDNNFKATFESAYKNHDDLKMNSVLTMHNKQFSQYAFSVMRKDVLSSLYTACSINKLTAKVVTSAGATTVNAICNLRPKLKNASFLFLDVKEKYSRFVFCTKDRAAGSYVLPFGFSVLSDHRMPQEDMLFDHYMAELTVLNAKEKAKAKALTLASDGDFSITESEIGNLVEEAEEDNGEVTAESVALANAQAQQLAQQQAQQSIKVLPKKVARKLPKFMLRDNPTDKDGYVYENFRVFVKWALTLIQRNPNIVMQGKPEFVVVNLPEQYDFVFEMVNNDQKTNNGLEFVNFDAKEERSELITSHLELYGGFVPSKANSVNVF